MAFSVWQRFITDDAGNILPGADVEVRREDTGALAVIYDDKDGTSQKSNPFQSDAAAFAQFYAGPNLYQITITNGTFSASLRNVPLGSAQAYDVDDAVGTGLLTRDQLDARYSAAVQDNPSATTDPTVNDDDIAGYSQGSRWYNTSTSEVWLCLDVTTGAAVWAKTTLTLDELGSMATQDEGALDSEFQDNGANRAEYLNKALPVVDIAGTAYTLTAADNGKMLRTTNASAVAITVPEDATEALPVGFQVIIQRAGDGVVTIAPEGTDVLNAAEDVYTIDVKWGAASVVKELSGRWWMTGALQAVIDLTGMAQHDLLQYDGAQIVKAVDAIRGGFIDYADDATQTTPLSYTGGSGYVNLPNDGAGAGTIKTYAPQGVADIYDTVNDRFDWSDLKLGDYMTTRFDVEVTTTAANQEVVVAMTLGVGGTPYTLPIARQQFKTAGTHSIAGTIPFDMGDANTLGNFGNLQIRSDANMDVVVNGWRTQINVRG